VSQVPLGELLLGEKDIDRGALGTALRHQRSFGGRLGDILVRFHFLDESRLVEVLARQLRVDSVHIGSRALPPAVLGLVPERLLRRHHAFPIGVVTDRGGGRAWLLVALAEPQDVSAIDELRFAAGIPVRALLAGKRDIAQALSRHFAVAPEEPEPEHETMELDPEDSAPEPMWLVDVRTVRSFRAVAS
jgi:type IV pilus assembly protein PilB